MKRYIVAHDLGTSGNKASLVSIDGEISRSFTEAYSTECPQPGWAQQDPEKWWKAVCRCNFELLRDIDPSEVAGICLTGQMMCCLPVDESGNPLYPAVIWADGRAFEEANTLRSLIGDDKFYNTVGMRISPNYGLARMMWLKKHEPDIYRATYKFLSPKDYINLRLTGRYVIDPENAAFWHCFDINTRSWASQLLSQTAIEMDKLPEILDISMVIGTVIPDAAAQCGLLEGTPVIMGPGDGNAATLGAAVLSVGEAYISLGTSSWVSMITGKKNLDTKQRIAKINYLETIRDSGTMQAGGYAYQWVKKLLCQSEAIRAAKENTSLHTLVDELAATSHAGSEGVLFQPYLMGERAPLWDIRLRGAFIGLTSKTTRADLCRSVMEGVALHLEWIYRCILETNMIEGTNSIKLIGGGAKSLIWSHIFADVFGTPIELIERPEHAGTLGTAVVGGVGLGLYKDYSILKKFQPVVRVIEPDPEVRSIYRELSSILECSIDIMSDIHHRLSSL